MWCDAHLTSRTDRQQRNGLLSAMTVDKVRLVHRDPIESHLSNSAAPRARCYSPIMVTRYAGLFCGSCWRFNSLKQFETDSPLGSPSFDFTSPDDYSCMHCFQSVHYKPQAVAHCATPGGEDPVCFQLPKQVQSRSFGVGITNDGRAQIHVEITRYSLEQVCSILEVSTGFQRCPLGCLSEQVVCHSYEVERALGHRAERTRRCSAASRCSQSGI